MPALPSLVWFRNDLRIEDQPALSRAIERGAPIIPVYIWSPDEEGEWAPGSATKCWLHRSLQRLEADLRGRGSRLIFRCGPSLETLQALIRECGASAVFWNNRYEPAATFRDARVKTALRHMGTTVESCNGSLLFEPWTIQTSAGTPFRVFTPFWRKCLAQEPPAESTIPPARWPAPPAWPRSLDIDELALEPRIRWDGGIRAEWTPGETGASDALNRFLTTGIPTYNVDHDRPDYDGTSRLSPFLHFGEIGPRQVWNAVTRSMRERFGPRDEGMADPFLRQLIWREFAHHLMFHFPQTVNEPLRSEFARFPWENDASALLAWQRGQTGYPFIDAGMRQLWATGWMHNRVRMVVASFLVKDLLIPWQVGARWFWDTLVDADLANNTLGWQWTAGCGADAAPYFRIFNPVEQGKRFDPRGTYIRRWVPELACLPTESIHSPWRAADKTLKEARVELGVDYPTPIIDHAAARLRALDALAQTKRPTASSRH
jgi:deoxyribodipyrimidine photo-lyase